MRRPRPRSVSGLLLVGFLVVALPLIAAAAVGVLYLDRLTDDSERLVQQGVRVTRLGRQLDNSVTAMERSARQYAVLGDPSLLERFDRQRRQFDETLGALETIAHDAEADWGLSRLREQAGYLQRQVDALEPETADPATLTGFDRLRTLVSELTDRGNRFIDEQLDRLQATAVQARGFLFLCVFALVPLVVALVAIFTVIISRPIRQVETAVSRLGEGRLDQPIRISAPSIELESLGRQLDWMRRRLAALESEKNQFLRHMSHELKTPLASIREGTELLRDGTMGRLTTEQDEVVGILHQSGLELQALIENLLNFTAWRQQRSRLARAQLDLGELLRQVTAGHRLIAERRGLRFKLPESPPEVYADREQIRLSLDNLVANAVKFSPAGGVITIRAHQRRQHVEIEIEDQGPGIPMEEREHIFAPFYQGERGGEGQVRGTGIGLSVVRECMRAHDGEVTVVEGNGGGACFRLRLPTQAAAA